MTTIHKIGNNFNKCFPTMKLFPGISSEFGIWQIDITYVSYDPITHMSVHNNCSFISNGNLNEFLIVAGSDVYDVNVNAVLRNNSNTVRPVCPILLHYHMRIDRLFMLNLITKLLANRLKSLFKTF